MPIQHARSLLVAGRNKHQRAQDIKALLHGSDRGEPIEPVSESDLSDIAAPSSVSDPYSSLAVVLACALSFSTDTSSKIISILKSHFPLLESVTADDLAQKVVALLISKAYGRADLQPSASQMTRRLLKCCRSEKPLSMALLVKSLLLSDYTDVCRYGDMWSVISKSFSGHVSSQIGEKPMLDIFTAFVSKTADLFASIGISGVASMVDQYSPYFSALKVILTKISVDSVEPGQRASVALLLLLLWSISTPYANSGVLEAGWEAVISSKFMVDDFFEELRKISNGSSQYQSWLNDGKINPYALIFGLLTKSNTNSKINIYLTKHLEEIGNLIFNVLPSYWSQLDNRDYDALLDSITTIFFDIAISQPHKSAEGFQQISSFCLAHLYSPHPLVHNIALDLWCTIIKVADKDHNKAVISQIGALIVHFAETVFLSSPSPSISSIQAFDHLSIRTRSIADRVAGSCEKHIRADLDMSISKTNLYKILQGNNLDLTDMDIFILDLLPLNYIPATARYAYVIDQMASNIHKLVSPRIEPSLRLLLCLRATRRMLRLSGDNIPLDSQTNLATKMSTFCSYFKQQGLSSSDLERVSDLMALVLDILSAIKPSNLSLWKTWLINCQTIVSLFPPLLKISFIQFLAQHISNATKEEIQELLALVSIFQTLITDPDWRVASEAIVAYGSFRLTRPLDFALKSSIDSLANQLSAIQDSSEETSQLVSSTKPLSSTTILHHISTLKVSIQRYATQESADGVPDLAGEYATILASLSSLEQKMALH